MSAARDLFRRILRDDSGAAAVEMAILAPTLLLMMFGVMQAGFYMQAQNSLRGIAAEISRHTAVEYQNNNALTNQQIEDLAFNAATRSPYLLRSNSLDVYATDAGSEFAGTRQIDLRIVYQVPNVLGFADIPILTLHYSRELIVPQLVT